MIRNVIFDWSGTLVNDFPYVIEATNALFVRYGKAAFAIQDFREKFYLPFANFYQEYLPEVPLPELEIHYHSSFHELQEKIDLLPHALETLEYCKSQGIKIFLLSTIQEKHYEEQATRLGLKGYFTQAYVRALDKREYIVRLLEEHHLQRDETIFVGDMIHDIETARHGGVKSCAVLTGYDPEKKLRAASPDFLYPDLSGFLEWLRAQSPAPTPFPIPTVGALIHNAEGKMLLVRTHKWSNFWGIPGGKIQWGETSEDALKREIWEETGLRLKGIRFVLVQDCVNSPEFYRQAHFILLNYVAIAEEGPVILNYEANDFRWVSLEEARALPMNTPTRVLVDHVYPSQP